MRNAEDMKRARYDCFVSVSLTSRRLVLVMFSLIPREVNLKHAAYHPTQRASTLVAILLPVTHELTLH